MVALPAPESQVPSLIYAHYKRVGDAEPARGYLGASIIGKSCERALWYDFRWASPVQFDGRLYRLFQTGHREEDRVINDLINAGLDVWARDPATGQQWSFDALNGHEGGHMDGIVSKVPEAPKAPHVLEVKTHNVKSFNELKKSGVAKAKPQHYSQMTKYMGWTIQKWGAKDGCNRALYVAVCKDTDEIYVERVHFDQSEFDRLNARAERVIFGLVPPRLSEDPTYFECKFCDHSALCHQDRPPQANCRTCAHSTVLREGGWRCDKFDAVIPLETQRVGCDDHRFIPTLLTNWATPVNSIDDNVQYQVKDGRNFWNGAPPGGFLSREIAAIPALSALFDPGVQEYREVFGAEIAG